MGRGRGRLSSWLVFSNSRMEPQGAGWLCYSGRALEAAWAIGKHGGTWLLQYTSSVALSICCPPELHWMAIHSHYSSLKGDWGHRTVGLKGRLRILAHRTCQRHALQPGLLMSSRPACSVLSPHLSLFILEFARCHLSCSFPAPVPRSPLFLFLLLLHSLMIQTPSISQGLPQSTLNHFLFHRFKSSFPKQSIPIDPRLNPTLF